MRHVFGIVFGEPTQTPCWKIQNQTKSATDRRRLTWSHIAQRCDKLGNDCLVSVAWSITNVQVREDTGATYGIGGAAEPNIPVYSLDRSNRLIDIPLSRPCSVLFLCVHFSRPAPAIVSLVNCRLQENRLLSTSHTAINNHTNGCCLCVCVCCHW